MNRALAVLIGACSAALLAPLVVPLFTGRVFVFNDLSWFHLPMRHLYQQALISGDSVLWTPSIFAGFYMLGEGQIGEFHPLHLLLYRFFALGPAFNLELITNYVAASGGTFWFFRRLQLSRVAALFGAMLFAFSGFNLLHHQHLNMVAVVAHMPWLLAASDVLIVDDRKRRRTFAFAAVALLLGSECLLGFPQAVWWNLIALAAFGMFRAGDTGRWGRLPACGAAVLVGTLLGAIQLLPSADAVAHSERMAFSSDFALTYSLHPVNLLQLWAPYLFEAGGWSKLDPRYFHEFGIYSGAILQVALIWVWVRRRALPTHRRLIAAVTAFAGVMLLLALGRYGGLAVLLAHLPVLRALRAPTRHIVLVQFALAILAAITLDDLIAIVEKRTAAASGVMLALWIPAALGIATTLALNTRVLPYGPQTFATAHAAAIGPAFVLAVTVLVFLAGRQVRWAVGALVIVTAADLGAWGIPYVFSEPPRAIAELTGAIPEAPARSIDSYAFTDALGVYPNVLLLRGYRLTTGYVGLFPASVHPLGGEVNARLSGAKWFFTPDGIRHPLEGGVERARLLDEQGRPAPGAASMIVDRPGHLVVDVIAPGRRTLALTERFHAGWSAASGDVSLETVTVDHDFLGCVVEAGAHRVSFHFMPRSFVYGSLVSAIGVALVAGVLIIGLKSGSSPNRAHIRDMTHNPASAAQSARTDNQ
jgi:hypothetical protein